MSIQSNFPAIKPTLLLDFANVEQLDPRITFSRASTATYYGTQTAKAEENLLAYSQEFENASGWSTSNASVVADVETAPDGTLTADKLVENTNTSSHTVNASGVSLTSGLAYTFSVFAKKGERTIIRPLLPVTSFSGGIESRGAWFDLDAGVLLSQGEAVISASISALPNGWYRVSITGTCVSSGSGGFILGLSTGDEVSSYTGDGTSGLFLWGAQLEQRDAVTAYTPTTTQPITNYIPVLETAAAGVARFDHNPTTFESLGLLIEEQRTNLLLYSEQFDNAAWVKSGSTITANTIVAPDGTLTGDKLVENATSGSKYVRGTNTSVSSSTVSFYAKAGERSFALVFLLTTVGSVAWFDLSTGLIGAKQAAVVSHSMTAVGNGWYRCTAQFASVDTNNVCIGVSSANDTFNYTGDGYSGIYIWGAQLEAGAFPTSYIPTVASQVTRSADAASMTGANFSSWYNAGEGTLYADLNSGVTSLSLDGSGISRGAACLHDGTNNNRIRFGVNVTGAMLIANNVTQADYGFAFSAAENTNYKIAFGYKVNSFNLANNNVLATEDTSGIVSVGVNQMAIGNSSTAGSGVLNGTIKKLAFYPLRLTNAQLQGLTS
jgi:hypothetical protein